MSNAQAQNGNVPVIVAAARIAANGTIVAQDGGIASVVNGPVGTYQINLLHEAEVTRIQPIVTPAGTGDDLVAEVIMPTASIVTVSITAGGVDSDAEFRLMLLKW